MAKEYLKMADVFDGLAGVVHDYEIHDNRGLVCDSANARQTRYMAHAINSHDELVAEVERLRGIISEPAQENERVNSLLLNKSK